MMWTGNKCWNFLLKAAIVLGMTTARVFGQNASKEMYAAANIPDSLKENANSIVRYLNEAMIIKAPGSAVIKHHEIVTIFNEKGDDEAAMAFFYNKKYDTYNDIVVRVYDLNGVQTKKYHTSDMYDGAAIDNETLVSDERYLELKHVISTYPTTIEVSYEETRNSFISPDNWYIQGMNQAVQYETYTVSAQPGIGFRFQDRNTTLNPVKSTSGGVDSYTWQVNNLKAFKQEDGSEPWAVLPYVVFGTDKFNCYGYPGDISSWQNLGKWIYSLNSSVCTLSPQRAIEIKKMTDTIGTDKAKAEFLYKYLQQNTRYVSVQLGIGGYRPFDADFVDQKKYGDCKALANYMYALLNAVNIKSCWAVVKAGVNEDPANPAFPNNQFNHEILCIPFKNDTTWLDCTSTTHLFGHLGTFTENRNALLITPEGGKLVNTPKSLAKDNRFNSEVHLKIDSDGSAKALVSISCTGVYRDDYVDYYPNLKFDEQKQAIMQRLNIRQASVFNYDPGLDNKGIKQVHITLAYDRFCDITAGNKQFYRTNVFDLCAFTVPVEDKRKNEYYFETPVEKSCITYIDLPKGYEIETLPTNQAINFTYGSYEIKYVYDPVDNEITSTAKFTITNQVIPAAKYNELQKYLDAVAKAQNKKLVIRKKA